MLADDDISVGEIGLQSLVNHRPERILLERYIIPLRDLCGRRVFPASNESGSVLLVQAVVDRDVVFASGSDHLAEVLDGVRFGEGVGEHPVEFAFWVEEVVVGVYDDERGGGGHLEGVGHCSRSG